MRLPNRGLIALLGLTLPLAAQGTTWIVDRNNGPGTNFLDLPPAVAQVASGDTLIVRDGLYTGFSTSKALTILGQGSVVVRRFVLPPPLPSVIEVSGLAQGTTFVMKNLRVEAHSSNPSAVSVVNNPGRIHLEDVVVNAVVALFNPSGLSLFGCNEVTVTGGEIDGWPAISCTRSLLALTGVTVRGGAASLSPRNMQWAREGLLLTESTAFLSRTDVAGGAGSFIFTQPRAAIFSARSQLVVTGDANTTVAAGWTWPGTGTFPTSAIQTDQGTVTADTQIQIVGNEGAPPFSGTATVVNRRIVSFTGSGGPPGGTLSMELVSSSADAFQIVAALAGDPVSYPPIGTLFIDPTVVLLLASGAQGPSGRFNLSLNIPATPALSGGVLALQAANGYLATGRIELSNPVVVVID